MLVKSTLSILSILFCSCTTNITKDKLVDGGGERVWHHATPINQTVKVDGKSYEIIDSESESLLEIKETKTNFTLNQLENIAAWERLAFFFKFYLNSNSPIEKNQLVIDQLEGNFRYQINRTSSDYQDSTYQITVKEEGANLPTEEATLKAKNLARFLKNGKLDQNLL